MSMSSPLLRYLSNPEAAEKLGLTEEQKTKLKALDKGRSASYDAQDKMRAAMRRQMALMEAEKIDEAALMAAIDEVCALRKTVAKEQAKRLIAVKSILTPEQVRKANEEAKSGSYEHGERGGHGERGEHGERGGHGGGMHRGMHGERRGGSGDHQGHHGGQRRRPGGGRSRSGGENK